MKYYKVSEAAKLTGYSRQHILNLIKKGIWEAEQLIKKGNAVGKHGSAWYIPETEIPAFMRKNTDREKPNKPCCDGQGVFGGDNHSSECKSPIKKLRTA